MAQISYMLVKSHLTRRKPRRHGCKRRDQSITNEYNQAPIVEELPWLACLRYVDSAKLSTKDYEESSAIVVGFAQLTEVQVTLAALRGSRHQTGHEKNKLKDGDFRAKSDDDKRWTPWMQKTRRFDWSARLAPGTIESSSPQPDFRNESTPSIGVSTSLCSGTPSYFRLLKKSWHSATTSDHSASALPQYLLEPAAAPIGRTAERST